MAVVTVVFPTPITGSELIAGIKAVAGDGDEYGYKPKFISEQRFDNGDVYMIGQYSKYPYDQILVAPSRESSDIRLDASYASVEIMDTGWPGSIFLVGYNDDAPINAVRRFAERVEEHFGCTPKPPTPVWPQDVRVCVLCERIVMPAGFDGDALYCTKDGMNPPVKTVAVVLA